MQKKLFSKPLPEHSPGTPEVIDHEPDSFASKLDLAAKSVNRPEIRIIPTTPLTWKSHQIHISKVEMNEGLRAWMVYDLGLAQFINTCVVAHVSNSGGGDSIYPIPDQYIEDLGAKTITINSTNGLPGRNKGDVMEYTDGVIHVMI